MLPWLRTEPNAGIHQIHVAESGNGWYRPDESSGQRLHLSRRTKMVLRLPKERLGQARRLVGATLDVGDCPLEVGKSSVRPLSTLPTLFARYVAAPPESDEQQFLAHAAGLLEGEGFPVRKLVCGRAHVIRTPGSDILTRSLMVADLEVHASVRLQQRGLGPGRQTWVRPVSSPQGCRTSPAGQRRLKWTFLVTLWALVKESVHVWTSKRS